jgi:hypothetical protein
MRRGLVLCLILALCPVAAARAAGAATPSPSKFVPVTPERLLDTRGGSTVDGQGRGGGPLPARGSVTVPVSGRPGVPAGATAAVLNVTAIAARPGYVQVFPTGQAAIGASSNLNIGHIGETIPNLVVVPLGDGGAVTIYTQGGGQFAVDLSGVFVTASSSQDGRYVAVTPTRLMDTRSGAGSKFKPRETRTMSVLGRGGVPASGVEAVALNVTATQSTSAGFIQVVGTGGTTRIGASSNLNVVANQTIANLVVVPIQPGGTVTFYDQAGGHLLADVFGYFTDSSAASSSQGLFQALSPTRILDSRSGPRPVAGSVTPVNPLGRGGVPAFGVAAVVVNLTATQAAGPGWLQAIPTGRSTPGAFSNVNIERAGETIAGAAFATLGDAGDLGVYTQQAAHLLVDVSGYFFGAATPPPPLFPASVSANGRYLLDQFGQPYLMQADSAWCLPNRLTPAQADTFFANRAAEGFNTVLITWACGNYEALPSDGASYDGLTPFVGGDWSQPTPAYWSRIDQYVTSANAHGIEIALDTDTGSFVSQMSSAGATTLRGFGQFLGNRYGAQHVIFIDGNDYSGCCDAAVFAEMDGIRDVAPSALQTVEMFPTISTTYSDPNAASRSDLDLTYSYYPTYDVVLRGYAGMPTKPNLFFEGNYENENVGVGGPPTTAETIRRQIYWSLTSGAVGQFYGNRTTYLFDDASWPTSMATPAVAQDSMASGLFRSLPWQTLVPDATFITSGQGTYDGSSTVDVLLSDYATAARTSDGAHAVVYIPTTRTVTIDASKLQGNVTARWFDPTTGTFTPAAAPFTTPGTHADGATDWVLVFG